MSIPHDRDDHDRPSAPTDTVLRELRALRQELRSLRQLVDDFARVYLNAKFPYGKPTDRWRRRA